MTILNRNRNPNRDRTYAKGSIDFDPDLDFDLLYYSALKQRVTTQQAARNLLQNLWDGNVLIITEPISIKNKRHTLI